MRPILALFAAAALLFAAPALAHDEVPVAGQVTAVSAKSVSIKTRDGRVVTLEVDGNTRVMAGSQRGALKDVKVGQAVKALGFGDSVNDLVAIDLTITPAGK